MTSGRNRQLLVFASNGFRFSNAGHSSRHTVHRIARAAALGTVSFPASSIAPFISARAPYNAGVYVPCSWSRPGRSPVRSFASIEGRRRRSLVEASIATRPSFSRGTDSVRQCCRARIRVVVKVLPVVTTCSGASGREVVSPVHTERFTAEDRVASNRNIMSPMGQGFKPGNEKLFILQTVLVSACLL
jgi:hypothetical protein